MTNLWTQCIAGWTSLHLKAFDVRHWALFNLDPGLGACGFSNGGAQFKKKKWKRRLCVIGVQVKQVLQSLNV